MDIPGPTPTTPTHAQSNSWAIKVDRLHVAPELREFGYNIEGRRIAGPMNGFGRLWQRVYTANLGPAVTPEAVVADWRSRFGAFWPRTGRFHGSISALQPGDVAPLTGGGVTTGIMVLYADDTSFSFLTPEGHMFAAMITFSCESSASGSTMAQIRILLRTSDPFFELMWPVARRGEDYFWNTTLRNLAAAHGVADVVVGEQTECIDRRRLWRNWTNLRYNSAFRSVGHALAVPFRPATGRATR